jgi:hypothetical protein
VSKRKRLPARAKGKWLPTLESGNLTQWYEHIFLEYRAATLELGRIRVKSEFLERIKDSRRKDMRRFRSWYKKKYGVSFEVPSTQEEKVYLQGESKARKKKLQTYKRNMSREDTRT